MTSTTGDPTAATLDWLTTKPGMKWHRHGADVLAAWVADMDFAPAAAITERLGEVLAAGDLGYRDWFPPGGSPLRALFAERMSERYRWAIDPGRNRELCDVVQGIEAALHVSTAPGDGVVLHTPAYPPFFASLAHMGRRVVDVPAQRTADGWGFDHEALATQLEADPTIRALLLCNPHNPTGHVFRVDELVELAALAERHDLLVISDEIHADLVHDPHRHQPIAALDDDIAARTVTVSSASKAFNLAGLRWAVMHLGHRPTLDALDGLPGHLLGAPNLMGVEATIAAWTDGAEWLDAIRRQLDRNRRRVVERLAALPGVDVSLPEATYLAWIDTTGLALGAEPYDIVRRAGVELSPGPSFGAQGAGFVRLNFATSAEVLEVVLDRVTGALSGAGDPPEQRVMPRR
ncbi:MAG: MalY/PatB family protein [Acidimicrobiia bacterium]